MYSRSSQELNGLGRRSRSYALIDTQSKYIHVIKRHLKLLNSTDAILRQSGTVEEPLVVWLKGIYSHDS